MKRIDIFRQYLVPYLNNTIDNKNEDNEFVQLFYDEMKKKGLPEYLIIKRNEVTKNILLSGYLISNDILEYLLGFIQL